MQAKRTAQDPPGNSKAVKKAKVEQSPGPDIDTMAVSYPSCEASGEVLGGCHYRFRYHHDSDYDIALTRSSWEVGMPYEYPVKRHPLVQKDWMAYLRRIHYRAEIIDGTSDRSLSPWTLKQIGDPDAKGVLMTLKNAEEQVQMEWRLSGGGPKKVHWSDLHYWKEQRRLRLCDDIWGQVLDRISMSLDEISSVEHGSNRVWRVRDILNREDVKALMFKDGRIENPHEWVATIDTGYQFLDSLQALFFNFRDAASGVPVSEDKVQKFSLLRHMIGKYFGIFISCCHDESRFRILEKEAQSWVAKIRKEVWKMRGFLELVEKVHKVIKTRQQELEDRKKKGERRKILAAINQGHHDLQVWKQRLARTYDIPEEEIEDGSEKFWVEWHAAYPEIKDDSDFSESEASDASDSA